jgi:voltage-gated potassium channel
LLLLLVLAESDGNDASIHSLWDAIWYSAVTLTTVGYGDMFPVTPRGQVIGLIFVFGSLGVIGFLLGNLFNLLADIKENRRLGRNGTQFINHIVVVGWNKFTHSVLEQLVNARIKAVVITHDKDDIDIIHEHFISTQIFVLYSEYEKYDYIREKANLDRAFCLFINMSDDTKNLVYLINYKQEFREDLKFPIAIDNRELFETFEYAGADEIIFKDELASKLIASYIFEPDVAAYAEDLLSSTKEDGEFDIQEYRVIAKNIFLNRSYNEVFFEIRDHYGSILLGIVKNIDGKKVLLKNPSDHSVKIELEDFLIIITNGIA